LSGPQLMHSPIGYIAPSVVLKTPQMGILLVVFPQKVQMKITPEFFLVCILVDCCSSRQERREGVGSTRINSTPRCW
jgi:hypothetical protein